jgi:HlyD family secretion protein
MAGLLRNRRLLVGALVVAALVAVAMWPRAIEVETATIGTGPMIVTIDEDGRTRVRDRFVVTAPVAGEVLRIELQPGDRVEKGKTRLATIRALAAMPLDPRSRAEAEAAVRATEAAVGRANAERARLSTALDLARRELTRVKALAAGGAVAREEVERRETEVTAAAEAVRAAEFAVAGADHELTVARARLLPVASGGTTRDWVITSPVDGVVLARHRESQTVVPAGDVLLEIGDPTRLEIVADMLSADVVRIRTGSRVLVEEWGGPQALEGRVRRIEPAGFTKVSALGVEEQRVNVVIDFDASTEAARSLGDNYRVEVRVVVWEAPSVVKVSPGALFRQGSDWAVYVLDGDVARVRTVTIGERNASEAEVKSGLAAGDEVIVYPPDTLADGIRVTRRQNPQAP